MENPFTARNMIKDPAAFFGRRLEIEEIFGNLRHLQNTSIVGERRIGKSSLLWHICQPEVFRQYMEEGDKPFVFIFFDLQKIANLSENNFFKLLAIDLTRQLPEELAKISGEVETWQERFAAIVEGAHEKFRIVICLDEFETLTSNPLFGNSFLLYLRHFANLGKLAYITSSREPLDTVCASTDHLQGSDFWNIFVMPPLYLGLLRPDEAAQLICQPSQGTGLCFEEPDVALIFDLAGYHPLFLQIASFTVFEAKKRKREAGQVDELSKVDITQIADNFLLSARPHFEHIWSRLSPAQRKVVAGAESVDVAGELKDVVRALTNKGILISGDRLHPFCSSFESFAKERSAADRQAVSTATAQALAGASPEATATGPGPAAQLRWPSSAPRGKQARLDVWVGRNAEILIEFSGPYWFFTCCGNRARIDQKTLQRFDSQVRNLPQHDNWRLEKQEIGRSVEEIFETVPELSQVYTGGRSAVDDDERFLLTFKCAQEMIAFPFEFINSLSAVDETQRHLILTHPMRKSIMGFRAKKTPLAPDFYQDKEIKILLVSSNVSGRIEVAGKSYELPPIPAAAAEVDQLKQLADKFGRLSGLKCQVETKHGVTRDEMAELIQDGNYDVVHYSGHGLYSESSEASGLFFRTSRSTAASPIGILTANELNLLVGRATRTRFIYLSCCEGARVGTPEQLLSNDFLGITQSLLAAGVPSVLSMRWPLSDDMAVLMAVAFYGELFKGAGLELACLRARKEVQARMPKDFNWLSPVLVVQGE